MLGSSAIYLIHTGLKGLHLGCKVHLHGRLLLGGSSGTDGSLRPSKRNHQFPWPIVIWQAEKSCANKTGKRPWFLHLLKILKFHHCFKKESREKTSGGSKNFLAMNQKQWTKQRPFLFAYVCLLLCQLSPRSSQFPPGWAFGMGRQAERDHRLRRKGIRRTSAVQIDQSINEFEFVI